MQRAPSNHATDTDALGDADLTRLAQQGDAAAFRAIMRRHNRLLYRVARSVVRDDSEAEDVVQEAYVRAFTGLAEFRGEASLSTWLTRIALNEALGRLRRQRPTVDLKALDAVQERDRTHIIPFPLMPTQTDPERTAAQREIRRVLQQAIDGLPEPFRVVFVLRDVEEMSVEETAAHLGLRRETVKTRLFRARRLLRRALDEEFASALKDTFPFAGPRCARITDAVLSRLGMSASPPPREDQGGGS